MNTKTKKGVPAFAFLQFHLGASRARRTGEGEVPAEKGGCRRGGSGPSANFRPTLQAGTPEAGGPRCRSRALLLGRPLDSRVVFNWPSGKRKPKRRREPGSASRRRPGRLFWMESGWFIAGSRSQSSAESELAGVAVALAAAAASPLLEDKGPDRGLLLRPPSGKTENAGPRGPRRQPR